MNRNSKKKMIKHIVLSFIMLLSLLAISWAQQQEEPEPAHRMMSEEAAAALRSGYILLNYENIDVNVLAQLMGEISGRNVIVDERLSGTMTVYSSRPVHVEEAWNIYIRSLSQYGYAALQQGEFTLIAPVRDVIEQSPVRNTSDGGYHYQTAVLKFKNLDITKAETALKPFISGQGTLQAYPPGKALIVTDRGDIIQKIAKIGKRLESLEEDRGVEVFFPQYAQAKDLEPVIASLANQTGQSAEEKISQGVELFEAGNALVVRGDRKTLEQAKALIARLDIPSAAPKRIEEPEFQVYSLQHAKAEEVAAILGQMLQERQNLEKERADEQQPGQPNAEQPTPDRTNPPGGVQEERSFISSQVGFDIETNSIITFLSPSEYAQTQKLLTYLDQPRKQIVISAVIAEASLSKLLEQGVSFQSISDGGVLSAYNAGVSEEGLLSYLASGSFIAGVAGSGTRTINVDGRDVNVPEFFGFLSANKSNTDFNLISAPRVTTQDHTEGEFSVGDVVPFATGASFDANGRPLITYDYRDVGIELLATPHISGSNVVRIELEQTVQEVTDFLQQDLGGFGYVVPLISSRAVKTTLSVEDGQTIVIGGLISKRTIDSIQKVPILGDLPLIGKLFQDRRKEDEKTTLFISLTPQVIERPSDIQELNRKYDNFLQGKPQDVSQAKPQSRSPYAWTDSQKGSIKIDEVQVAGSGKKDEVGIISLGVTNKAMSQAEVYVEGVIAEPNASTRTVRSPSVTLKEGASSVLTLPALVFEQAGSYGFDLKLVDAHSRQVIGSAQEQVQIRP